MRTDTSVLSYFFTRTLLVATCVLACSMGFCIPVRADVDNCQCDTEILLSDDLSICIGGVNYIVDVYGCKRVGTAPNYLPEICLGSQRQDQYTTVTRVCFVGPSRCQSTPRQHSTLFSVRGTRVVTQGSWEHLCHQHPAPSILHAGRGESVHPIG